MTRTIFLATAAAVLPITPAVAHRIPVAWINRKGQAPAGPARPDRSFRTLTELADWLA